MIRAIAVWSLVHGFISLYLEQQFPGRVLEKYQLKNLLEKALLMLELEKIQPDKTRKDLLVWPQKNTIIHSK